ncbi:PEP-CTERM sorting domain-containing protein [Rosistilla oblonga]|uniref:PEP-CTERM sorting domain-containing protein n=1 Tax=Rosistilla oblonga TaxID=2527990 RepID=UPI003A96F0CB
MCALSAQATISTNFADGRHGQPYYLSSGTTPRFSAVLGAGQDGVIGDPGQIYGEFFGQTEEFYGPAASGVAFGLTAPGGAASATTYVYFQDVMASSVQISGYISRPADIFHSDPPGGSSSTDGGRVTLTAYDGSGNVIAGSSYDFNSNDDNGNYDYSFTDTVGLGIRSVSFLLSDMDGTGTLPVAATITSFSATATPEPSSMALLGLAGLSGAAVRRYRRRRIAKAE